MDVLILGGLNSGSPLYLLFVNSSLVASSVEKSKQKKKKKKKRRIRQLQLATCNRFVEPP